MIYFYIGLYFYLLVCFLNKKSFKEAKIKDILYGFIFGVLVWPISVHWVIYQYYKENK